uniref:CST complex subunit CTC1 n=1 Tax=Oryza barthii TaxID=65489 RepID=A0A0D3H669_9ORYZ
MPPPPPAERRLTVADLLLIRRPTTGAASLVSSSTSPSPSTSTAPPPRKKPRLPAAAPTPTPRSTAPFAPIPHRVLLAGALSLPASGSPVTCRSHCLSLSDSPPPAASASASVCCYLLDFDPDAVGREIHVLAWNYLPSLHHGGAGVLEVVRWRLAEEGTTAPGSGFLKTIPLDCVDDEPDSGTHGHVFGVVRSVSVVFSVPRAGQKSNADGGDNSVGFISEMMCCACRRCRVLPPESDQDHKFELEKFVYFVDSASRWRPVLARMVGRPVSVSGLKKRLVSIDKKGTYTMLVSTRKTMLRWCPSYPAALKLDGSPGDCGGVYTGVVTGIYMQRMLVELDETVWLLIDDQHLAPSHSLRVGAVISVKNGRAICLKLAWTRTLLLGTCIKTSITINSFSLVDSKSYIKAENKGLLGKFVDSFELPARFWMLILIPCFKQKFTKLFSEKEILGSKNHDFFMTFSNHNCGSPRAELNLETFKLVIPFANFICKCESLWILTMLKIWNGTEEMDKNQGAHQYLCDGISYPGTAKKLISSSNLSSVLVGRIKRSSVSGTLQLVDATGCIDVVIPDLPPNVCMDSIYEINDYKVVLEGPMAYLDPYDVTDPLSCKAICEHLSFRKRLNHLKIYVIINWSELNRIGPSSIPLQINACAKMFHLLKLTHIFPANKTFQHQNLSGPSLYAEAVILPYDLKFTELDECSEHAESFRISCIPSLGNSKVYTAKPCNILCTLSFGTTNLCGSLVSIYSCGSVSTIVNDTVCGERDHTFRILLEFKDGRFKYQSLRIGGYYLLECPTESMNYSMKGCGCLQVSKVSLGYQSRFWSLAITFNGNINIKQTIGDQSIGVSSVKMDEPFSRKAVNNEIKLVHTWNDFHQYCDFHLKFYCDEKMDEYNYFCDVFNELCPYSNEVLSISSFIKTRVPKMPSGSSNLQRDKPVQGDLISLQGKVENIHPYGCKKEKFMVGNEKSSICIHVTDNNHRVRLFGYLSKYGYPVGLGPGASATFHRVLLTHKHELFVTPLTYIEVSSISLADLNEECVVAPPISDCFKDGSLGRVSSCLLFLSHKHLAENRAIQFQCRVVTIHVLVLDDLQPSKSRCETINVKVRLAGFIVDDGSSLCCCWADDARAELLLGLPEVAVMNASVTSRFSKDGVNIQQTVGSFLESLLKKHKRIIARNCGIPPDISCRDLELSSVLNKVLSCSEEKLLKSIILNACWKGTLNVIASALNANTLNGFNLELPDLHPVRNMPNYWVNQAFHIDPLEEGRKMFDKLESS